MERTAMIGDSVIYTDELGHPHKAVVTAVWGTTPESSINLVYVSSDVSKTDSYGRQIERATSVVPQKNQSAHGRFYSYSFPE